MIAPDRREILRLRGAQFRQLAEEDPPRPDAGRFACIVLAQWALTEVAMGREAGDREALVYIGHQALTTAVEAPGPDLSHDLDSMADLCEHHARGGALPI